MTYYVFDTSAFILLRNFYRERFPTLWKYFDDLVATGGITSTREVRRELEQYAIVDDDFIGKNKTIFTSPTADEAQFIKKIYAVPHFQQNIEHKKIEKGGLNADPFVIAKAAVNYGTVVTLERGRPNAAKIPNICQRFNIRCFDLEQFMEAERWQF